MISQFHVSETVVPWLLHRGVRYTDAVVVSSTIMEHGTAALQVNGTITYEFAETYDDAGVTGFDVRVQNALI